MTTLPKRERFDLLAWTGSPTEEEQRNKARWGVQQPPTVLGYGVTLTDDVVQAQVLTVTRKIRKGPRVVTLVREEKDGTLTKRRVRVQWDDALKPARWGDASFDRI